MVFANYAAFRVAVIKMIEGDDDVTNSLATDTADLLIGLGENRVYRDLRASCMVEPLSATVTDNAAAIPSRLLELKEVYFDGQRPLEIVGLDRLRRYIADGYASGQTRYCAQDGDNLVFWPEASGTVLGSYYARPANAMKDETDWANQSTVNRYPECFLFAVLSESAPFYGFDARIPVWEQKYQQALRNAHQNEQMRAWGGSPLRVRAR